MKKIICLFAVFAMLLVGCTGSETSMSHSSAASEVIESSSQGEQATTSATQASSTQSGQAATFTLTVPEGYTLARIGMQLEEMGICTAAEFISATQTADYSSSPLIAAQPYNENRCFTLEGYLFPNTYEFYTTATPEEIARTMLNQLELELQGEIAQAIAESGYTTDEILTMASIIEKESFGQDIMALVSSVLHNRLEIGMRLQTDVTINYVEGAIKPFITGDEDRYNDYYNTYKCDALPAGPICNPGIQAIMAALNPADTNYFYFVTDSEQTYHFAETYEQHLINVEAAGL